MSFKPILRKITGLNAATVGCLAGATVSIALAFMQADRASKAVATPPGYALAVCGAALLGFCAVRAIIRRRWISVLLHGGCVLVGVGWLVGQYVAKHPADGLPVYGAVAMIDGDESNTLYTGDNLTEPVGKLPFSIRLERFMIDYYPDDTVREYRSRVTITEPGKEPYVRNIRVNHPARVCGYDIYQMSWGQAKDMYGRPLVYTVLQFQRDPGVPLVYAGYLLLFAGVTMFAFKQGGKS
jgi:ResB protein required for cytochrome c biosynthesis